MQFCTIFCVTPRARAGTNTFGYLKPHQQITIASWNDPGMTKTFAQRIFHIRVKMCENLSLFSMFCLALKFWTFAQTLLTFTPPLHNRSTN